MDKQPADEYPSQTVVDVLRLIGYVISKSVWFIRYTGREHIPDPSAGGLLIAANHQTYVDPVWICLPMRRKLRFMAIEKAFEWRVIGPMIRYLGAFPVSMEIGGTLIAMKKALRSLRNGAALTVFPEGGRAFADGQMLPFKTGAVRIALQAGVPILPVTVRGGERIWPQKQKYPRLFRRVEIIYHPLLVPVNGDLAEPSDLDHWTERLREIIASG
ncbi:MAG: lysophospholipid acyltransferase family protein [Pyrinomonadaceae bacterium]